MNNQYYIDRIKTLIDSIQKQIDRVKNEDAFLFFPPRVYELAISHKLAEYLQDMFYKHNVDVEYDKYGYGARKELDSFHNFCDVNSTDKIRPDIIVHYRGIRFGNILVMEIKDCKASKTSRDCVDEKLKRLTDRNGQFGYLFGALWLFGDSDAEELFFYINGNKYDSKLYKDMNEIFEVLCNYESSSIKHYRNFLKFTDDLKRKFRNITKNEKGEMDKLMEEEERVKTIEEVEQREISDSNTNYGDYINYLSDSDIYDIYQETGEWNGPFEREKEEIVEPSCEEPEEPEEDIQGLEEQQYEYYKNKWTQECIEEYKQGKLFEKDFYYVSIKENNSESRELWLDAWQNLYFLSTNSILFDHLYCIKKQKELLEMAFEYDPLLNVFGDDAEKKQAEEHLEFITAWIEYQLSLKLNKK